MFPRQRLSPSLMIFLAAMADDRWMGSMKMLAASEPEMVENLDSEAMEKLTGAERGKTEAVRRDVATFFLKMDVRRLDLSAILI